jgi:hypothetical protein
MSLASPHKYPKVFFDAASLSGYGASLFYDRNPARGARHVRGRSDRPQTFESPGNLGATLLID